MKKLSLIILLALLLPSCKNKDLIICDHTGDTDINVIIHWEEAVEKPSNGMMVNFLPLGSSPSHGIEYLSVDGGVVSLFEGANYKTVCYDYYVSDINFTDDHMEAICKTMIRGTYSRVFPDEDTIAEPGNPFWVDRVDDFLIDGNDLHHYPENIVTEYTFEVRGVEGAEFIVDTRGAITGMSNIYCMGDGALGTKPYSILFKAAKDGDKEIIYGSFCTFGRLDVDHMFTIEILYPSKSGGIIYGSWDVTDQVINAPHIPGIPDIIIDNNGQIPPIDPIDDSVFELDVEEWDDVIIPIPM